MKYYIKTCPRTQIPVVSLVVVFAKDFPSQSQSQSQKYLSNHLNNFYGRSYSNFDDAKVYRDAKSINWIALYHIWNVHCAAEYTLLSLFDAHAPLNKIKSKSHQPCWITRDFSSCIDKGNTKVISANVDRLHIMKHAGAQLAAEVIEREGYSRGNILTMLWMNANGTHALWPTKQQSRNITNINGKTDQTAIWPMN